MKIEKVKTIYGFYCGHKDSKTDITIWHGLYNSIWWGIGYHYHDQEKGFWFKKLK